MTGRVPDRALLWLIVVLLLLDVVLGVWVLSGKVM